MSKLTPEQVESLLKQHECRRQSYLRMRTGYEPTLRFTINPGQVFIGESFIRSGINVTMAQAHESVRVFKGMTEQEAIILQQRDEIDERGLVINQLREQLAEMHSRQLDLNAEIHQLKESCGDAAMQSKEDRETIKYQAGLVRDLTEKRRTLSAESDAYRKSSESWRKDCEYWKTACKELAAKAHCVVVNGPEAI